MRPPLLMFFLFVLQVLPGNSQGHAYFWEEPDHAIIPANFHQKSLTTNIVKIEKLGSFPIRKPAFLSFDPHEQEDIRLMVTSFEAYRSGTITAISDLTAGLQQFRHLQKKRWRVSTLWPNEVKRIPEHIMGAGMFTIADGFLVPGKGRGAIIFYDEKRKKSRKITKKKTGWFYHQVIWADINQDGLVDVLTARAKRPENTVNFGELVWLENPGIFTRKPWREHLIRKGPDVSFLYEDIDGDGSKEIIATEFFPRKMSLIWQEENDQWRYRVIDKTLGSGFNLQLADLNNDGQKDLLVTNHENNDSAAIFAYEFPEKPKSQAWTKHTLLEGIKTRNQGRGQASPGKAEAIHLPTLDSSLQTKPIIIASGDGSQRAHLLVATSEDPSSWDYRESVIVSTGGTVGQIASADIDGDGRLEVFIPAYDANLIYVYRLSRDL